MVEGEDAYTGDSIRPKIESEESEEEDWEVDEEEDEDLECRVCGVGGEEDEEAGGDSEDEGVSPFKAERRAGDDWEDEVRRVKAIKDERAAK